MARTRTRSAALAPAGPSITAGRAEARRLFRNAADVAADLIRKAVVDGRLTPGERLREEQLAETLGISRTPIREALLILQTEGIVEGQPNRGCVVRSFTPAEISDVYETRAVLEAHAAARAARDVDAQTVEQLRASNKRFESLLGRKDPLPLVEENLTFHRIVLDAANSPTVNTLVHSVTRLPLIYRAYYWYSAEGRRKSLLAHQGITKALAAHDPERAERLMREHIMDAREVLLEHLGADNAAAV